MMKTLFVLLFFISVVLADGPVGPVIQPNALNDARRRDAQARAQAAYTASAPAKGEYQTVAERIRQNCAVDRWRIIEGEVRDLEPTFAKLTDTIYATQFGEWEFVTAKVVQVLGKEGILFKRILEKSTDDEEYFRLKNYRGQSQVVDDTPVAFLAYREKQTYHYTTTTGAGRTIRSYDYGARPTEQQVALLQAQTERKASEERERRLELNRQLQERAAKQRDAVTARVVNYQLDRASNGYPSFQYEIGKRFLMGDGVPQNKRLAKFWLESACTNGLSEATNLLAKMPSVAEIVTDSTP